MAVEKADEKRQVRWLGIVALLVVAAVLGLGFLILDARAQRKPAEPRTDLISLEYPVTPGHPERAPSVFLHQPHADLDTTSILAGEGCRSCHPAREDGALSFRFMRLNDELPRPEMVDLYHDRCIGCHTGPAAQAGRRGPDGCGQCHVRRPEVAAAQANVVMDLGLHARHVKAFDGKCEPCHHVFDEATQKLVYMKGKESSCRDCHGATVVDARPTLRTACHAACVNCHLEHPHSGPTSCVGCHDLARFLAYKRPDPVPRLERGQPDVVLVHAAVEDIPQMEQPSVPFDHRSHERDVNTCRVCHHEKLLACRECHTLAGEERGGHVPLAVAYHAQGVDHSCVGCHETRKAAVDCAGCHSFLPHFALAPVFCQRCHSGPPPAELAATGGTMPSAAAYLGPRSLAPLTFTGDQFPDSVTIDRLADKYAPAVFPHRKVVDKLRAGIAASPLATHFHAEDDLACTGCHHHSPVGARPPACSNCHGQPFQPVNMNAPGLYGAFHQQCLGCHERMHKPTDCTYCHAARSDQAVARADQP